ncbi:hypothetical protein M0R72_04890 [Candidatus Pacearchaeota archaeon]|jgi:hypothetical protein|nr:hypothetical protein [Candidatus Pacearchaeota archaeon]
MKKIFLLAFVFLFVMSFSVMAANENAGIGDGSENGNEVQNGSVISTQNQGEDTQIRQQVGSGTYFNQEGKEMQIESGNGVTLRVMDVEAHSSLNITQTQEQNRTRLHVQLSNGQNAEVKIMPDTASETAIARLRLVQCNESNNCTIELKEVGSGEEVRAAYEVQAQKETRVLGLFKTQMQVEAQVDAETGEIISEGKPWWAFLASE